METIKVIRTVTASSIRSVDCVRVGCGYLGTAEQRQYDQLHHKTVEGDNEICEMERMQGGVPLR